MSYEEEEMMDGDVPVAGGDNDPTVPLTKEALRALRQCKGVGKAVLCTADVGKILKARKYVALKMVDMNLSNQDQGAYNVQLPKLVLTPAGAQFLATLNDAGFADDASFKPPV